MGWFGWQTLGAQVQDMLDRSEGELEQVEKDEPTGRMILIEDTWNMAKEKPWFGWGLATFAQIYPRFQNPRLYQLITFPGGEDFQWVPTYYQFAHCDWLQYAAETGFVGLFLLMATPLAWVFHCHRRGRRNPLTHWLHVGALLILFQAIFELPFASEAVALLFAACVALGGKYALLEEEARKSRRKTKRSRRSRSATEESEDDLPPGHVAT
jgi:O-antigen ligase